MGLRILAGFGRLLISLFFLLLGASTIYDWEISLRGLAGALANWELAGGQSEWLSSLITFLSGVVPVLLIVILTFQILGGLSLFLAYRLRLGATFLILYLIITTVIYHPFWLLYGPSYARSLVLFMNNIALLGALFLVLGGSSPPVKRKEVIQVVKKEEKSDDS
jgi:putative oxidoreductase